ncbi:MAG: phosphate/phosphite/phosphonate ABC transporter substrate-binding protein [Nitrososphaerota archaeon]|nr:phosphate/phosphite/phosphonate ABC transporter substrate-binding protein [Candidatus Calditenuaceae archaeon]MDW8073586.1 phosphate/phosphite/phosphonate ABC transporter substrate-binding protein [Nitrososphaerota archaeon]
MTRKYVIAASVTVIVAALAAIIYLQALTQQPAPSKIIIAIQPTQNPLDIAESSKGLKNFLEKRLGIPVEVYVPTDYAGVIEGLRFRNVHVALMGSWPSYLAIRNAGAELLLAEVRTVAVGEEKVNATYYYSYWIVLKDSPYGSLSELRGRRACFPSPISSSGYLAPMARMVELGLLSRREGGQVNPSEFFGEVIFAGGYGQCWEALRAGQVDVTVMAGDVSYELYTRAMNTSKVLEAQGPLPSHGVVVTSDLPEDLKQKLREAFIELSKPEYRDLMKRMVSALFVGFEPKTAKEHLGSLEKYIEATGLQYN